MRRKKERKSSLPSWLDTYADMVTLLLTFFVLLFSMSSVDAGKWNMLVKAFQGEFKPGEGQQLVLPDSASAESGEPDAETPGLIVGDGPGNLDVSDITNPEDVTDFDALYYYLKNYSESKGMEDTVGVYKGDGYTFVVFQNNIFFDGNSAEMRSEAKTLLDFLAGGLKNITGEIGEIRILGHTARAGQEFSPSEQAFDRELSIQRATNVLLYLQMKNIIDPKKLVSEGYGEFRPLVPHDGTEAARIQNRRVEIYISKTGAVEDSLDSIYSKINTQKAE